MRRRRRVRWVSIAVALLLLAAALVNRFGRVGYSGDDWQSFDQKTFVVARVVDGDTVRIRPPGLLGGDETTVRLLGIDAPEVRSRDDLPPDYWADHATDELDEMVEGRRVVIRLDQTDTRDRYERLLAYLYEDDGDNINLMLVEQGHVYADRRFRHTLRRQFEQAEYQARDGSKGLWKKVKVEQMPAWRQRWLEQQAARRSR
jgi:micrococcal nuclease